MKKVKPAVVTAILICLSAGTGLAGSVSLRINCTLHSNYEVFFMEVLGELCRRLDVDLQRNTPPVGRSLILVDQGVDDGDGPRIAGLQARFPNLIRVEEPFGDFHFGAFTKTDGVRIDGWHSLKNFSVAYLRGWKFFDQNVTAYRSLTKLDDADGLFRLLANDRVEVVLSTKMAGGAVVEALALENILFVEPPLAVRANYLYLHKRHGGLARRMAQALRQLKADGGYDDLYRRFVLTTANRQREASAP